MDTTETSQEPLVTTDLDAFGTPAVVVEVDPDSASELGAFEESALSEEDAWTAAVEGEAPADA